MIQFQVRVLESASTVVHMHYDSPRYEVPSNLSLPVREQARRYD